MYGIREGYAARHKPDYFNDTQPDGKVWQPDVYNAAFALARHMGVSGIIDIGCGRAHKLVPVMNEFLIVGIDYGENVHNCNLRYPQHTWIASDLEHPLPSISTTDSLIIAADVIEHLQDPTALLTGLTRYLERHPIALLSTPDRLRSYGYDHGGAPSNVHHTREWALAELTHYITTTYPLWIQWQGYTRSNNVDAGNNTILLALTRPGIAYPIDALMQQFKTERVGSREA